MVRSVVGGRVVNLTADEVTRSMRGTEPETIQEHFVVIGDKLFPPKEILAQVTGWDRQTFTTMEAIRVLRRLGFGLPAGRAAYSMAALRGSLRICNSPRIKAWLAMEKRCFLWGSVFFFFTH